MDIAIAVSAWILLVGIIYAWGKNMGSRDEAIAEKYRGWADDASYPTQLRISYTLELICIVLVVGRILGWF